MDVCVVGCWLSLTVGGAHDDHLSSPTRGHVVITIITTIITARRRRRGVGVGVRAGAVHGGCAEVGVGGGGGTRPALPLGVPPHDVGRGGVGF